MKVLLLKKLPDGRGVLVYDDGSERNNIILLVSSKGPKPIFIKRLRDTWDWEEKVPEILGITKDELGL